MTNGSSLKPSATKTATNSSIPTARDKILRDMERDFYMSPAEAQTYGLIDRVIEPRQLGRFASGLVASGSAGELPGERPGER